MLWSKRMFSSAGDVAIDVHDVATAQRWYSEKLGLLYFSTDVEEASMEMGYSADLIIIYLTEIPGGEHSYKRPERPPIMFARKLTDAHECLSSRSVDVGPIQSDSGGNKFFHFRD